MEQLLIAGHQRPFQVEEKTITFTDFQVLPSHGGCVELWCDLVRLGLWISSLRGVLSMLSKVPLGFETKVTVGMFF